MLISADQDNRTHLREMMFRYSNLLAYDHTSTPRTAFAQPNLLALRRVTKQHALAPPRPPPIINELKIY